MNSTERKSSNFIVRSPLLAYFVLSYTFFWGFLVLIIVILGMLRLQPDGLPAWAMPIIVILGSWMPNLAAVTVTGVLSGHEGIRQLLGKFFAYRIAVRWYLVALFPFLLAFVAAGLYRLAGGTAPGNMGFSVVFGAGLIILNLLQGATGEEAGWRGFALPRLQETYGPVKASLILGLIWNFWHLPLWLLSGYSGIDLLIYVLAFSVSIISLTFLLTWISSKTPNSLIPIVITHFSFNASLNIVDARGLGLGPTLSLLAITAGIYLVTAILVWSAGGWSTRKHTEIKVKSTKTVKEAYAFLGLTLTLSYFVFWGPLALFKIPTISFVSDVKGPVWAIALLLVGGFVPSLLAIFLTWKKEGVSGLRLLGRRIIQFKLGWRWYVFTFLIVMAGTAGQLTINKLLGNTFKGYLFGAQLGSFLPLLILGPVSEEIGWRGYALGRLQTRWNALTSSLIVGLFWAFWHLPLFMMVGTSQHESGVPFIGFLLKLMASSILYTWLYNNTKESLWSAILLHWLYTYADQVLSSGVTQSPLYNWLEYLPYVTMAAIVVFIWKYQILSRPMKKSKLEKLSEALHEENKRYTWSL